MKRLESLESILQPLAPSGKLEDRLVALTELAQGLKPKDSPENIFEPSPIFSTPVTTTSTPINVFPESLFFQPNMGYGMGLGSFLAANAPASMEPETLEVNLVRLGYMHSRHIELSISHRLNILSRNPQLNELPVALKEALCAYGVLYSTHPDLFSSVLDNNQPSKQIRVKMAKMYIRRCEQSVQLAINAAMGQMPFEQPWQAKDSVILADNQLDKCDTTRALMIISMVSYGLGDGRKAVGYIRNFYSCR